MTPPTVAARIRHARYALQRIVREGGAIVRIVEEKDANVRREFPV